MARLFHLGEHRLLLGDACSSKDMDWLLQDCKISLVVTDPPYGVNLSSLGRAKRCSRMTKEPLQNDDLKKLDFARFLAAALGNIRHHQEKCLWYVFVPSTNLLQSLNVMENQLKLTHRALLVWVKNIPVITFGDYLHQSELILFYGKTDICHMNKDRTQSNVIFCKRSPSQKGHNTYHPTRKPLELIERLLLNSSLPGDDVVDPFVGSGTTLLACERTGRKCLAAEIEEKYVYQVIHSWITFTSNRFPVYEEIGNKLVEFTLPQEIG